MKRFDITQQYKEYTTKKIIIITSLIVLTFLLSVCCLSIGASHIGFARTLKALFGTSGESEMIIVRNIRLPRVIAAIAAGAGLSAAGCVMQSVLNNPMASPSTLGVSNAAVFGANIALIVFGTGTINTAQGVTAAINDPYATALCAFVFAVGSALAVLILSGKSHFSSETVVLAGIALGYLFSAGTAILQYFANDTQLGAAVFWTFGDLGRATKLQNTVMCVVVIAALVYFFVKRWDYNAISSGDEIAKSLGVNVERTRFFSMLAASLICAVCVSFLGMIGFVGLIAPHAVKRFVGSDHRFLIPASALAGAILLLAADLISRSLNSGASLPIGAITSLFGAPMFICMLIGRKKL